MKKLICLLFLVVILSCEKDSRCWNCTINIVTTCSGYASDNSTVNQTLCDYSNSEIKAYERSMNTTVTSTSGGITCTIRSSCKCRED